MTENTGAEQPKVETATATESQPTQTAEVTQSEKPKSDATDIEQLGNVKKRIDKYVAQAKAAEERAKANETLAANYAAELAKLKGGAPVQIPKPDKSRFTDPMDYADAVIDWEKKVRDAAELDRQQQIRTAQVNNYREVLATTHRARATEMARAVPDYDETVNQLAQAISEAHVVAIQSSPNSAEVAYFIAKNPDIAAEFRNMNPMQAAIKVGEITAELRGQTLKRQESQPIGDLPAGGTSANAGKSTTQNGVVTTNNRIAELRRRLNKRRG